jgi:hypothetical protein
MTARFSYVILLVLACADCSSAVETGTPSASSDVTSAAEPATPAEPWTDTAMQSLVAKKCAASGCHDGSRSPNLKGISESAMKADTKSLQEVNAGKMPRRLTLTAAEKDAFAAFYE